MFSLGAGALTIYSDNIMRIPEAKILIASGDKSEADRIGRALEIEGRRNFTIVSKGSDALSLLEGGADYLLIASWELPGLGGLRLARIYHGLKIRKEHACILILPEYNAHEINIIDDSGIHIDAIIARPFNNTGVSKAVKKALGPLNRSQWPLQAELQAEKLIDSGRPEKAVEKYNEALNHGRERLAGIHTEIGHVLLKKGKINEALDHLETAVLNDPLLERAQAALGRTYLEAGRPAEAAQALGRASALNPNDGRIKTDLAESLLQTGKYDRAEVIFKSLIAHKPGDLYLLNRLGMALRKQNKYSQALTYYSEALRINDQDENLLFNIGRCCFEVGDFTRAITVLNQALNLKPDFENARSLLGKIVEMN